MLVGSSHQFSRPFLRLGPSPKAVERVRVHIHQEEKFEKGGCRLSVVIKSQCTINLTKVKLNNTNGNGMSQFEILEYMV